MKNRPKLRHLAVLSLGALSLAAAPATGDAGDDPATVTEAEQTDTTSEEAETSTSTEESSSDETASEPDASATAVEVEGVVVISEATASEDSASATVLEVGGERVVGGDAEGGSNSGAVLDTEETELGRLAVGPWSAETSEDGSRSQASVAEVTVVDEDSFYAHVLRSRAAADGGGGTSASSDAVAIGLAGEDEIRVLSSTWTADGPESALIRQGDDTIGQDADGQCQLEIPSILHLLCLTGSDGQGGMLVPGENEDAAFASVVEASLVDQQGAAVLRAGGERSQAADDPAPGDSAPGDSAPGDGTAESPAPGDDDGDLAAAPDGPETEASSLPMTGGGLTVLAAGLLLLAIGLVLRRRAELAV